MLSAGFRCSVRLDDLQGFLLGDREAERPESDTQFMVVEVSVFVYVEEGELDTWLAIT